MLAAGTSFCDALLTAALAPPCAICGVPLDHPTRSAVCGSCWSAVPRWTPPWCARCGEPLPSWRSLDARSGLCARCRRHPPRVSIRRAVGPYDGRLREIVHAFKYEGLRSLAPPLARLMAHAGHDVLMDADWVVPVPLHRRRRRRRGFNQAADLARALGPPVLPALRRIRATQAQVSLPAGQRRRNVRGAFALAPVTLAAAVLDRLKAASLSLADARRLSRTCRLSLMRSLVAGRRLVLIDDVATTGATLEACAAVLLAAGAAEVRALTAAQAVTGLRPSPPG